MPDLAALAALWSVSSTSKRTLSPGASDGWYLSLGRAPPARSRRRARIDSSRRGGISVVFNCSGVKPVESALVLLYALSDLRSATANDAGFFVLSCCPSALVRYVLM